GAVPPPHAGGVMAFWARRIGIGLAVLYVALVGIHVANGFGVGDSLSLPVADARMLAACPSKPNKVWAFVTRSPLEDRAFRLGQYFIGDDLYGGLCETSLWP